MDKNIRIVREAGGVGDILRLFPTMVALKKKYAGHKLWMYVPKRYARLLQCSGVKHTIVPTPNTRRKRLAVLDETRWAYLEKPDCVDKWDFQVDEYCPAFAYEVDMKGLVKYDRSELFCQAAGVFPCDVIPKLYVGERTDQLANRFFEDYHLKEYKAVATIQPFSTDRGRDWPKHKYFELCNSLVDAGVAVLILDGIRGRTERFSSFLRILGEPLPYVAAIIRKADFHIGPDSGLMHVAAAVGTPALVLMASQPFNVTCKNYKKHVHVSPPSGAIGPCATWPCMWSRPRQCFPNQAKRTCPILRRIQVRSVLEKSLELIAGIGKTSSKSLGLESSQLLQRTPVLTRLH